MKRKTRKAAKAKTTRTTKTTRKGATGGVTLTLNPKLVTALKEKAKAKGVRFDSFCKGQLETIAGI